MSASLAMQLALERLQVRNHGHSVSRSQLLEAFRFLDTDDSGALTPAEMADAFNGMGIYVGDVVGVGPHGCAPICIGGGLGRGGERGSVCVCVCGWWGVQHRGGGRVDERQLVQTGQPLRTTWAHQSGSMTHTHTHVHAHSHTQVIDELVSKFDHNQNGTIEYDEFVKTLFPVLSKSLALD